MRRHGFWVIAVGVSVVVMSTGAGCDWKTVSGGSKKASPAPAARAAGAAAGTPAPAESARASRGVTGASGTTFLPAVPEPAPSPLAISMDVAGETLYAGDPLAITVRLVSPQARARAYATATQVGAAEAARAAAWPSIPAAWAGKISLTLKRRDAAGKLQPVGGPMDWGRWLQADELPAGMGNPARVWLVPADADLPAGEYVLEATWAGRGLADAAMLPADGVLRGEAEFELIKIETKPQQATHLYHVAQISYRRNEFAQARQLGRQAAVLFGGEMTNQRIDNLIMIADCSTGLGDVAAAVDEYQVVLGLLPRKSPQALDIERRVAVLKQAKGKK